MWWKVYTVIIVPVILAGWMSAQRVHGLGFSSFGKANTETPKPAEPTAAPGWLVLFVKGYRQPCRPPDTEDNKMWCRQQAAVAIFSLLLAGWLTGESSEALTTFGKSNTQAPKAATTPAPARQCQKQGECAGISGTSCVRTAWDPTTRCLCGDNQPPVNGQCEATQSKNLYHMCATSDECNDGLVCLSPNVTATTPYLRVYVNNEKICLCDTENGYKEKDHSCSDADIVKTTVFAVLVVTCIRKLIVY